MRNRLGLTPYLFLLPALTLMGLFTFYPAVDALALSFTDYDLLTPRRWAGLKNFERLFSDPLFWKALRNSVLYVMATPIIIVLSITLAVLVNRPLKFIGFFRAAYYIPAVTSTIAVGLAWQWLYAERGGLINGVLMAWGLISKPINFLTSPSWTLWSVMLVIIWRAVGFYMVIFLAGLQSIPEELYEAASIDGANRLQRHLHITIPGLRPYVAFVAIISSVAALKTFDEVYIMTDGKGGVLDSAITIVFYIYRQAFINLNIGYAAAISLVFFLITISLSILQLRLSEGDNG